MTKIDPARAEHETERQPASPPRRSTATRGTRIIGIGAIVALGWLIAFGLGFSPADRDQLESVRILYVHVPTIWLAYLAFIVTAVSSAMYLFSKKKSLGWDRAAGASAEIGVTFVAVTLAVGAMWGRLTWGVFWQWDARLTTTALLFVSYMILTRQWYLLFKKARRSQEPMPELVWSGDWQGALGRLRVQPTPWHRLPRD